MARFLEVKVPTGTMIFRSATHPVSQKAVHQTSTARIGVQKVRIIRRFWLEIMHFLLMKLKFSHLKSTKLIHKTNP